MTIKELCDQLKVSESDVKHVLKTDKKCGDYIWEKRHLKESPDKVFGNNVVTASGAMAIKEALERNKGTKPEAKAEPGKASVKEPDKPKRKRRTKAEMEAARAEEQKTEKTTPKPAPKAATKKQKPAERKVIVANDNPFFTDFSSVPISKCRMILAEEKLVKIDVLAYTSDEAARDILETKFVGIIDGDTIKLYKKQDLINLFKGV